MKWVIIVALFVLVQIAAWKFDSASCDARGGHLGWRCLDANGNEAPR